MQLMAAVLDSTHSSTLPASQKVILDSTDLDEGAGGNSPVLVIQAFLSTARS